MTDYTELIHDLRYCADRDRPDCSICGYESTDKCKDRIKLDAAAAIEELDAEETRLLLLTSDLQDKLMDLEEQLNDADIAADDNGRQVEELQAEIRQSMQRCAECGDELAQQLPKRGEWINSKERMRPDMCSVCGCIYEADRFMDKIAWNYCPNCGAKMEVQE